MSTRRSAQHLALLLAASATLSGLAQTASPPPTPAAQAVLRQPISFEANVGQHPADIRYVARSPHFTALLGNGGGTHILLPAPRPSRTDTHPAPTPAPPRMLTMELVGGNPHAASTGEQPLTAQSNYFLGSDPKAWRTAVPNFAQVRVDGIYPRIDMVYYATNSQLEYDFLVAPHADPHHLRLHFSGQDRGPRGLRITLSGDIALQAGTQQFTVKRPVAYQVEHGRRQPVPARFVEAANHQIGIGLAPYNHALPLTIDPKLEYSTYLGGSDDEGIFGIAFDPEGNIYLAGETSSVNFPTTARVPQPHAGGNYDAFISKLDPSGKRLIYSTYLGGSQYDHVVGIAVDRNGSAYVAGITISPDFPVVHALQSQFGGVNDAFISRLDSSGAHLLFSTYLGGSSADAANSLALDRHGDVFVAGSSSSVDLPTTPGSLQPFCDGRAHAVSCSGDGFLAKLTPAGEQLFTTYLGGSSFDLITSVKVDDQGAVYVAGQTESTDFPTKHPFQPALAGFFNAFVTKISSSGRTLEASSYLGGNNYDAAEDLALDAAGNIYLTGFTNSTNFPTLRPIQASLAGGGNDQDAFVTKIQASTFDLAYSTYLGGSSPELPFRIVVDPSGAASITGFTYSTDFPVENPLQPKFGGGMADTFVSRLDPSGSRLSFSTYLGGSGDEFGYALSTDWTGALFLGGSTSSPNFPLQNPFQPTYGGGPFDAYLSKITLAPFDSIAVLQAAITNLATARTIDQPTATVLLADLTLARIELNQANTSAAREALLHFGRLTAEQTREGKLPYDQAIQLARAAYEITLTL